MELMKLIPLTREMVELICTWMETKCATWSDCQYDRNVLLSGILNKNLTRVEGHHFFDYFKQLEGRYAVKNENTPFMFDQSFHARLLRITSSSTVSVDWPWLFSERFVDREAPYTSNLVLIFNVLGLVADIGDSVFVMGAEQSFLPWNFPFPVLSNSPYIDHADIAWPWPESLKLEWNIHKEIAGTQNHSNFAQDIYSGYYCKGLPWEQRKGKSVYYGNMEGIRQVSPHTLTLKNSFSFNDCSIWIHFLV